MMETKEKERGKSGAGMERETEPFVFYWVSLSGLEELLVGLTE